MKTPDFINYALVKQVRGYATPAPTTTPITTPYGAGWRLTSTGDNWQWAQIIPTYYASIETMNEPILRFMLRASGPDGQPTEVRLRLSTETDKRTGFITNQWQAYDFPIAKNSGALSSWYGAPAGTYVETSAACLLMERTSLERFDTLLPNLKVFTGALMMK